MGDKGRDRKENIEDLGERRREGGRKRWNWRGREREGRRNT